MKIIFLTLSAILVSCNELAYGNDSVETYSPIAVDKFREIMRKGNSTLGIPILDPFKLVQYIYELDVEDFVTAQGLLRHLKVDGLSSFEAKKADFNIIGIETKLHLLWNDIKLFTNYSIKGTFGKLLKIYGIGDVNATAKGLDVDLTIRVSINDGNLYVRSFKSAVILDALDIKITGLFLDDEISNILSDILSDMVPTLIRDYQEQLTEKLNYLGTNALNELLKGKSITDLISIISS